MTFFRRKIFSVVFVFLLIASTVCNSLFAKDSYLMDETSGEDIIRWGLIFSMCEENSDDWIDSLASYKELYAKCEEANLMEMEEWERGDKLLFLIYENLLKKYSLKQTKIDVALLTGIYNCVSSSIVYLALAVDFGLDARVQQTTNHAFVTVYLSDGRKIDVETTNPYGFDPGKTRLISESEKVRQYVSIPKTYYSNRKEVSERGALILIEKNLCAEFIKQSNYTDSIHLAALALNFVEKEKSDARKDLDLLISNKAVIMSQNYHEEEALDYLEECYSIYGKSGALQKIYDNIAYNSAVTFCSVNKYEQSEENFEKRKSNISEKTGSSILKLIMEEKYLFRARSASEKTDFLEAARICEEGLQIIPSSSYLKQFKKNCLTNYGKKIHNDVVPYLNSGDYAMALSILESGLAENPDSIQIKNDIKRVNQLINNAGNIKK